ncbi:MAG: hypothetical protein RL538_838 [Candidatus Parcubacteria bacterium]|jgi:hypothetical protein
MISKTKFFGLKTPRKSTKQTSSEFSDFFRKASSGEKKKVFSDVARRASAEQKCFMN